jgi:hypothetical protein
VIRRLAAVAAVGALLGGCATAPPGPPPPAGVAAIARGPVYLTLPRPPAFPTEQEFAQSIVADYGPRKIAFDALVSLGPDRVTVIVTAPAGPRLAQIDWTAEGVRTAMDGPAPPGFRAENVLADLVVARWPKPLLEQALGGRLEVWDYQDGRRKLVRDKAETIIEVSPPTTDASGAERRTLTNYHFDYRLTIITRGGGGS